MQSIYVDHLSLLYLTFSALITHSTFDIIYIRFSRRAFTEKLHYSNVYSLMIDRPLFGTSAQQHVLL